MNDPSQPLNNTRHELFAIQKSKGVDNGAAWQRTIPFGTKYNGGSTSLRVTGFRVSKRPEVQSRINWLISEARNEAGDVQETFDRSDVIKLNLEVSDVLEAAYKAAVNANVSPLKLEQLRTVFASHLSRQGKLAADGDEKLPDDEYALKGISMIMWMNNVESCRCP